MARIAKSLVAPEQGYAHRDHRSKKGRVRNLKYLKKMRARLEQKQQRGRNRKGKWIV